jgi:transcriptional regulator GlxA family with amidase domain
VGQLTESAIEVIEQLEAARVLEQALLHAMISCFAENTPVQTGWGVVWHNAIIARFEELLEANFDRPLHLAEICVAIGSSERTLRVSCMEHLGMGPVQYLWLRWMRPSLQRFAGLSKKYARPKTSLFRFADSEFA